MIGKIGVIAGNRFARVQVLGFQRIDVSGEDEFGLCLAGCGAVFKFSEGCLGFTRGVLSGDRGVTYRVGIPFPQ